MLLSRLLARLDYMRTALIVVVVLAFGIGVRPAIDNDLWWHLRSGQWMVAHHHLIGHDPFSHTKFGAYRPPSDWLSQLGLYGTWRVFGLTGVAVLTGLLAAGGTAVIAATTRGTPLARAAFTALGAASSSIFWSARPQMVTFVFVAITVAVVVRAREGKPPPLWIVPLFALWANLHLGWFWGLGLLGLTVVAEVVNRALLHRSTIPTSSLRRLTLITAASALAALATPAGVHLYSVIFTQIDVGRRYIEENQPPRLSDAAAWPFFAFVALSAVVVVRHWRRLDAIAATLLVTTAAAGLTVTRSIPLFATVAAAFVSQLAKRSSGGAEGELPDDTVADHGRHLGLIAIALVAAVALTSWKLSDNHVDRALRDEYPVDAVAWLDANRPPGALFNTFDWGGYVLWHARTYPVSIDGRAELYDDFLPTYAGVVAGDGWQAEFAREGVNVALVPRGRALDRAMRADSTWRVATEDANASLLIRTR